ncbi:nucleoside triphosphate pyrophosphohydrolase [Pseudalkalibacillus hwajinpoensis]|uniref:nucleoside triphosphate pyrophosphohydrolase n=1 Tax=Guptibacillus hwajinpoensis TaxID=208199 RepID=UPI001CD2039F|nr:nucleoside triphosphate pyrophosphohydrolase [Pseudalkalibacillus hwajinpoensis]MCA0993689.1 nucleoside triphosphate pyrophosphohydrolase [Pseudalkalibacillus hwajinpoensis]
MASITIIGTGAGDLTQLSLGSYRKLKSADRIFARTLDHPVLRELMSEGLVVTGFDNIYESNDSFEETYRTIVDRLFEEAQQGSLIYAVPGHPMMAEATVQLLLEEQAQHGVEVIVAGGQSFLDDLFTAVRIDPIEGCQILDATRFTKSEVQVRNHLIFVQVYDQFTASSVKLTLMELLPDDYEVTVLQAAGSQDEKIMTVPLFELDRSMEVNNLTAVYVPPVKDTTLLYQDFEWVRHVVARLRGPGGCPWDQKQTHESLKKYLIEEAYEVLEAIDDQDGEHLSDELGDVLLQVLLHAQIGEDEGMFTMEDVIGKLSDKLIRRHPHVFGNEQVQTAEEVVGLWNQVKEQEKDAAPSQFDTIQKGLPGLMRANELQKSAAKVGFDWDEVDPILEKVQEELTEFKEAVKNKTFHDQEDELGDLLFALVNVARYYKIDPEVAIHRTNHKFVSRFQYIERRVKEKGLEIEKLSLEELDYFWNEAKQKGIK